FHFLQLSFKFRVFSFHFAIHFEFPAKIQNSIFSALAYENENGEAPLRGHSLSWSRVGESNSNSFRTAKLWMPQQNQSQTQSQAATVSEGNDSNASSSTNSLWLDEMGKSRFTFP